MKDKIIEILMLSTFTKRKELLDQLHYNGWAVTDRDMRKAIESLIVDDHFSIASSEKGYSLIQSEADLKEAMKYFDKKAESISIRKNCLLRNFMENKVGQLKLSV